MAPKDSHSKQDSTIAKRQPLVLAKAVLPFVSLLFSLTYGLMLFIFQAVVRTYFREVRLRGTFNIPRKGPVIFVCAPHHNLFIDPVIVMITSYEALGRPVLLLTAAKTYKTKLIGTAAKLCGAIPVERAQDLVKPHAGRIWVENFGKDNDNLTVIGEGTNFTKTAMVKGLIGLHEYLGNAKIKSVDSDTKLTLQKPFLVNFDSPSARDKRIIDAATNGCSYVLAPHIDNDRTFRKVFDHLNRGRALGIFPEGGLHDQPRLLPLKPGVALMALGAVAQAEAEDQTVTIVPVGLNYFNPNAFRSSVVIEYGSPIVVTKKDAAEYEQDSRGCVSKLLEHITLRLEEVTVTCEDFDTLITIQAARRLYAPTNRDTTPLPLVVEMNRRLIKGYETHSDKQDVQDLKAAVAKYNKKIRYLGLHDHQVMSLTKLRRWPLLQRFLGQLIVSVGFAVLSLPGFFMFSPIFLVAKRISLKKARQALALSVVKLKARDVVALWKIIVAMVLAPALYVFWAIVGVYLLRRAHFGAAIPIPLLFVACYLINVVITYSSLRTGEIGVDSFRSLVPLFYALMLQHNDVLQIEKLKQERIELAAQVTDVCEKYGPLMFDDYDEFQLAYQKKQDRRNLESVGTSKDTDASKVWDLADVPIFSQEQDESPMEESANVEEVDNREDGEIVGAQVRQRRNLRKQDTLE